MKRNRSPVKLAGSSAEKRRALNRKTRQRQRDRLFQSKRRCFISNEGQTEWNESELTEAINVIVANPDDSVDCLRVIRRHLCSEEDNGQIEIIGSISGAIQSICQNLQSIDPERQLEAAWCITNLAFGSAEIVKQLVPVIPQLVTLLSTADPVIQEQCCWALGNISSESVDCRGAILSAGVITPLLTLLKSKKTSLIKISAWTISSICRYPITMAPFHEAGLWEVMEELVRSVPTNDVMAELAWVLVYMTGREEELAALVTDTMVDRLVQSLWKDDFTLMLPSMRALGNLISSSISSCFTKVFEHNDFIGGLKRALADEHRAQVLEACWVSSNICATSPWHAQAVIDAGLLESFLNIFEEKSYPERREIIYILNNILGQIDGPDCLKFLLEGDILQGMMEMLHGTDLDVSQIVVGIIERLALQVPASLQALEEVDVIPELEELQASCGNRDMCNWIDNMINETLILDHEDDEHMTPTFTNSNELNTFAPQPQPNTINSSFPQNGRGRGNVMPAWMNQQQQQQNKGQAKQKTLFDFGFTKK
eukprot:TRINITY_DN384_c1_g1_i1.p1 TRINITY_DN384_c1_g1~~TRINITY_DN384_c1_g1_i1.p1  ORF type:complete len:540 (+),score=131.60 TRINITY_DN384_c1_g1_i1:269-1888(+)